MLRIQALFLILSALLPLLCSAAAPTFCKCTCFTNSTIIPLGPGTDHSLPSLLAGRAPPTSCAQCNRAFCLRYNLPICKGAEEKDVTTMCFQRDSRKDQIIVWGFILGTVGLLGWAAGRRLLELRAAGPDRRPAASGWAGLWRGRGVPAAGAPGLGIRDDAARGVYSPIGDVDEGPVGHRPG